MTLYEINEKLRDFEFEIDEETGEIMNEDELDALEMSRTEKMRNICMLIKNYRAEAAVLKAEADAFTRRYKHAKNEAESLANYLQRELRGESFKCTEAVVSYRKSEAVECDDVSLVPADFLKYKEPEIDKAGIKAAIKNGVEIRGCRLVERQNIQIK